MFARSIAQGSRHSVLVTHPMSDGAMRRLQTFFDVETRVEDHVPSGDELVGWLWGKAGVIADTRFVFDAQLVRRLPVLKAICNLDADHHNLDLEALTTAGIRATSTPASVCLSLEAQADQVLQLLTVLLRLAVPPTGGDGRYRGKWSRRVLLDKPVHMRSVGVIGAGALADTLVMRAQLAQFGLVDRNAEEERFWGTADVVICIATGVTPPVRLTAAHMAWMKPEARVLNLAGPDLLAPDVLRDPVLMARILSREILTAGKAAAPDQLLLNRTQVAAEDLIASLGFGRNSWHPKHLLNPDILCESCC